MNKICTSIEQSKKLIELGFDVNTADLTVTNYPLQDGSRFDFICCKLPNDTFPSITDGKSEKIPAWSLSALLYLLNNPQLFNHDDRWNCDGYTCIGYCHDNAVDAVFEVVEVEAEKLRKGAKKHGIRRSLIKNK